ncbi:type II toxin-antitoxin system prevent-host-death family antitoxin [Herbiconiux sp. CPCC 205763]|uniref:Antitoxin n=2 Tax=Herbiconiux aconitum TaxID=2970913 RepID=A0ABT2GPV2_9MICO|nr:type II toxin-antitoxin system prevent-host-death family antitoxin [Herbiconiux aconitum]MCS5716959.1 type II toxin-antitoxin system prevent-host-death family antitoxin [Herbiconiux aconitum]
MESYDMLNARNQFAKLIARAEAGEEVVVSRRGKPVAKIVRFVEEPEYFTGKTFVEWLEANPLPEHLRKTPEEIDAIIADLRGDDDE